MFRFLGLQVNVQSISDQSEHALCLNHVIILFSSVINLPGVSVTLIVARVPVAIKGHGDILIFAVWS